MKGGLCKTVLPFRVHTYQHISPNGYVAKSNYLLPCEPVMGIKNLLAFEAVIFQRSNRGYGSFI